MFMWRVLSGAIAVAECLRAHGMQAIQICQICKNGNESIVHVLVECDMAKQVWQRAKIPLPQHGVAKTTADYMKYFLGLMGKATIPGKYKQAITWLLWGIWKQRNAKMYAGNGGDADIVIAQALEEAEEWKRVNSLEKVTEVQRVSGFGLENKWRRPPAGVLKCNINSSWVNSSRMCGGSWIVRDHRGEVKFHARDAFLPAQNRIVAELRCVLWVMQSLLDLRILDVEIWSESGAALEALNNLRDWSRFRSYLDRFYKLKLHFHQLKLTQSSSKTNVVAWKIVSSITMEGRLHSYLATGGPTWLSSIIDQESRG
ncbi:putative protein phosphatase 2C-like protein 45 [Cardamine amara subsp. amara]|uniref:RNase H type-1 domain-containing protein n=1 Tax=Cardamine amara subsp. amara TaxID=228776 RepID=A0ABD0ZAD5_CARAN